MDQIVIPVGLSLILSYIEKCNHEKIIIVNDAQSYGLVNLVPHSRQNIQLHFILSNKLFNCCLLVPFSNDSSIISIHSY